MFEEIFFPRTAKKYRAAPFVEQREQYLVHLRETGTSRCVLRKCANNQLGLVRLLNLKEGCRVRFSQIEAATKIWAQPKGRRCKRLASPKASARFLSCGIQWLRYLGWLEEPEHERHPHHAKVTIFEEWLRKERGLSAETTQNYCHAANRFFFWLEGRRTPLDAVQMADIDAACAAEYKRGAWSRRTAHDYAQRLKSFFLYAETRSWCRMGLAAGIMAPRFMADEVVPKGIKRNDVLRLLASVQGDRSVDKRDRAILMLFVTYGLRAGEVAGLRLDDLDWENDDHSGLLPEARTDQCLATLTGRRQCHFALHTGSPSDWLRSQPLLHIACAHPTG